MTSGSSFQEVRGGILAPLLRRAATSSTALSALRRLPAEAAHDVTLRALAAGLAPPTPWRPDPILAQELWGRRFASPLGVAAGFDKAGVAVDALLGLGAGFVEIGAVTPRPQPGNPKPRVFRLPADRAVINRLGFNNAGMDAAAQRLRARPRGDAARFAGPVGVNVGANKDASDRMADYEAVVRRLWGLADFFTVNVSSPNTEKLRDLQGADALAALLTRVKRTRDALVGETGKDAALLVKIAPDLEPDQIDAVADVCLEVGLDGAVATNTTVARPASLASPEAAQAGGLSGAPLFETSTEALRRLARRSGGALPLIGVGGVDSAETAYSKIRAGATLVQLYTGLVYGGPRLFQTIPEGLAQLLRRDGFATLADAVGVDL